MKRLLLILCALLCTGCTALPAEERAFAVVLGVDHAQGTWTVHARIPTYQTGGGYTTIGGDGASLPAALAALEGASPMHLHLDQLRLLIFSRELAGTDLLTEAVTVLSSRHDLRMQAAVAVTEGEMKHLMDALEPETGARLSKAIDVLLETRSGQGHIPEAPLDSLLRMGDRQSPVLIAMDGEKLAFSGGWMVGLDGRVSGEKLEAQDVQLLSLMQGKVQQTPLSLEEGTARVTDVSSSAELSMPDLAGASVRMTLRCTSSTLTAEALRQSLATSCLRVLNRLSAAGCDALGLGRQAVMHMDTMEEWRQFDWPSRYPVIDWTVGVGIREAAGV